MKVLKCVLVDHSKKESENAEVRFFVTELDEVAKGDIFAVWAHGKLAYAKVKKVFAKYEYLSSDNNGIAREDLPVALNRIDFKSYNVFKKVQAKLKRLQACLEERIVDGKKEKTIAEAMKGLKGEAKAEVEAILKNIATIESNPESVLDEDED